MISIAVFTFAPAVSILLGVITLGIFLGMISAFPGMVFADIRSGLKGWIPIFVLLFSAFIMGICGILVKKCGMK